MDTVPWKWKTLAKASPVYHWFCQLGVWDMVPFEFKRPGCNPEIKEAEFGYVADLNQFVQLHLDENEK